MKNYREIKNEQNVKTLALQKEYIEKLEGLLEDETKVEANSFYTLKLGMKDKELELFSQYIESLEGLQTVDAEVVLPGGISLETVLAKSEQLEKDCVLLKEQKSKLEQENADLESKLKQVTYDYDLISGELESSINDNNKSNDRIKELEKEIAELKVKLEVQEVKKIYNLAMDNPDNQTKEENELLDSDKKIEDYIKNDEDSKLIYDEDLVDDNTEEVKEKETESKTSSSLFGKLMGK